MSDAPLRPRLLECFRAVFPDASDDQLAASSTETNPAWDSVAHITLITVIEEEFGCHLPEDRYGELTSFAALAAYLESPAA